MDKIETAVADVKADVNKVETRFATAEKDVVAVRSWFAINWHYAVAIAVGALFLGLALGYKLGMHSHA
jgi:hypothetical protein